MRTFRFSNVFLCAALAAMMSVSAFAQPYPPTPYEEYDSDKDSPTNVDYVTLKTGGTTMGYYALPDTVYHPNYVTTGALTAGFWWNWTNPVYPAGGPATFNKPAGANYVTIRYPALGNYEINVAEHAPDAYGGACLNDSTVMNVTVVSPPSAGFTTPDSLDGCGSLGVLPINMSITESVPAAMASYAFKVVLVRENINVSGARTALIDSTVVSDFTLASKGRVGSTAGFTGASPNFDYDFNSVSIDVANNLRTKYTYYLVPTAGVTGSGIVSAISHKSDYLAGQVNGYAFTDASVAFVANPAPVTGPIYYVPNDFNY